MGKFSDLAKQGIRYQPLEEDAPEAPKNEQGNFSRGFEKAMLQVPQTLGGSAALVGDLVGSDGLKEYGLGVYQKNADKIQAITKDSDSLSNVIEGDASAADWLKNSAGYVAGQAIQAVATGGVGGFIGSQLAKRGIGAVVARGANSLAAREVASKVAAQGAKWGAGTAMLGNNLAQEAGSIYPEAVNEALNKDYGERADGTKKGRGFLGEIKTRDGNVMTELSVGVNIDGKEVEIPTIVPTLTPAEIKHLANGGEPTPEIISKAAAHAGARMAQGLSPFATAAESPAPQVNLPRVVGSAIAAAGVDTAMDALMLKGVLKGARKPGESMARAAMREVPGAMAREGVTEGIQTGIERYGAGQELDTASAIRDYVDSMGVGMVGGGMGGAASVIRANKAVPESGPLTRAANIATEQEVLQLENHPQPLISFPDGSVGTQQELHAYLSQFADPEERQRKEHELMGRDPETGKPVEQPEPEPAKFADTPEQEAQSLAAWGAEHDPVPIEQAHALLAAPGTKGESLMVAPHPSGEGFTVVPSNWLTLDTQAKLGDLQKPIKPDAKGKANAVPATADAGTVRTAAMPRDDAGATDAAGKSSAAGAVPDAPAAPASPALNEPEWKTNPYTAYKFADAERAANFMANKGADPALFEVKEIDGKFAIKRRAVPLSPTEGASNGSDNAILAQDDGAARGSSDQPADVPGRGASDGNSAAARNDQPSGTADAGAGPTVQPDNVRDAGSADAEPALTRHPVKVKKARGSTSADVDKTLAALPPVAEGHTRLFRAESPTTKFEDVFNADGLSDFKTDLPGARYTPDLKYADYYRQSYGPDAAIHYVDVPNAVAEKGKLGDAEYVIDVPTEQPAAPEAPSKLDAARAKHARQDEEVRKAAENIARRRAEREAAPAKEEAANVSERPQVPDEAPPAAGEESAQAVEEGSAAAPADGQRDDGADIPLAFFAKVKVPHDVHVEETGTTETIDVPADQALASVREDIDNLQALLKCMKGGA